MTLVRDFAKDDRRSNLISVIALAAMWIIGVLIIIFDPSESYFGYGIAGLASAWKFWTWGDSVDKEVEKGMNSYTVRTNSFGETKVEKDQSYIGCITAIVGLVLGIVITPIFFVRSLLRFLKQDKAYKFTEEVVAEMENHLKIRYTYNKKTNKWSESVL